MFKKKKFHQNQHLPCARICLFSVKTTFLQEICPDISYNLLYFLVSELRWEQGNGFISSLTEFLLNYNFTFFTGSA